MEQLVSPDIDTREFADLHRVGGYVVLHHQYMRGRESEIIEDDSIKNLKQAYKTRID